MNDHDQAIIHSSQESDWRTPPGCFEVLNQEFRFGWDLAANAASTLHTADSSGLSARYLGPGSVHGENALEVLWACLAYPVGFLNPPFSREKTRAYSTGRIKIDGVWREHPVDPTLATVYDIAAWAEKCWLESQAGCTIVGLFPFAPQTDWYRKFVYGHTEGGGWSGHAAREERRLPHRISFLRPDGSPAGNAGVNTVVIVWGPRRGTIGPWQPWQTYWSWR